MEHKENESGAKKNVQSTKGLHEKKLESFHAGNLTAWFIGYNKRSEGYIRKLSSWGMKAIIRKRAIQRNNETWSWSFEPFIR